MKPKPQKALSIEAVVTDPAQIGKIVRQFRKNTGLTQMEAAAMCKVGTRFLSDLENGKSSLHLGKVLQVMRNFGLLVVIKKKGPHND